MVPILISKDVAEPSHNDLKFMVQNCNYFFTNLCLLGTVSMLSWEKAHNLFTSLEKIPWGEPYGQSSHTCSENSINELAYTSSFTPPSVPTTTHH